MPLSFIEKNKYNFVIFKDDDYIGTIENSIHGVTIDLIDTEHTLDDMTRIVNKMRIISETYFVELLSEKLIQYNYTVFYDYISESFNILYGKDWIFEAFSIESLLKYIREELVDLENS
uniref:Uncharacterized protein n=1 Tax=viral metagenome TaxID=1070528 RepID=A0A6C0JSX7_9ZZZZ